MAFCMSQRGKRCGWLFVALACLGAAGAARATEYHGRVLIGGVPIPGAVVTVTQGTQHLSTTTDSQGLYEFADLANGAWKIEIEMRGFAKLDGDVTVAANGPQGEWELKLLSLEQMLAATKVVQPESKPLQPRDVAPPAVAKKDAPVKPGKADAPVAAQPAEEAAERPSDGLLINGSESNASTSPFSLTPAFGNRRPGVKSLYNGGFGVIADNSVFDARPYSLSGAQLPKGAYNRVTMLATLGGPIRIPPLFYHGPNFFLAYQWTRDRNDSTAQGLVPTVAERGGDLSGVLNAQGQPVTVYNPATGVPYTGAVPVSVQAQALLALYPLPNTVGSSIYNYEREILTSTHVDALQSRLNKSVGHRDQLYGGFGFQSIRTDSVNLFNFNDKTNVLGLDTNVNWQHRYAHQLFVLLGYHLTRQRTQVQSQFEDRVNVSGNAGITGNDPDPANWGSAGLELFKRHCGAGRRAECVQPQSHGWVVDQGQYDARAAHGHGWRRLQAAGVQPVFAAESSWAVYFYGSGDLRDGYGFNDERIGPCGLSGGRAGYKRSGVRQS